MIININNITNKKINGNTFNSLLTKKNKFNFSNIYGRYGVLSDNEFNNLKVDNIYNTFVEVYNQTKNKGFKYFIFKSDSSGQSDGYYGNELDNYVENNYYKVYNNILKFCTDTGNVCKLNNGFSGYCIYKIFVELETFNEPVFYKEYFHRSYKLLNLIYQKGINAENNEMMCNGNSDCLENIDKYITIRD